jgi:osmotically-inducible protein OsmY
MMATRTKDEAIRVKDDMQIRQDVLREIARDSRLDGEALRVSVDGGMVTLTGSVPSYIEKLAAREAAHRVPGVRDVADEVKVVLPGTIQISDAQIARLVRTTLEMDVLVPHKRIQTTVSDGWVTLEGHVDLWRQFEDAERAVRHLVGVVGITNKLVVTAQTITTDQVHTMIEDAITRQAERTAEHIQVAVRDGVVTLAGKVRTIREKQAVLEAVRHAQGVGVVSDHLLIDPLG